MQRIGFVAELLARNGVKALVPVIAPYADSREAVRKRHQASGTAYLEVHVATPVEVCSERDVKGLYAKQAAGEISGLTGVDDPYEEPRTPDLRIESQNQTVRGVRAALSTRCSPRGDWHDDRRHRLRRRPTARTRSRTWTRWSPRRCTSSARWRASSSGR